MEFHQLPNRFMELPAQAIRCRLHFVFRPRNSDGSEGSKYPDEAFEFIRRFRSKPAIGFFFEWLVGQVGRITEKSSFELTAQAILYPMDNATSINLQFALQHSTLASVLTRKLSMEARKHNKIRLELIAAHGSKLSASIDSNLDEKPSPTSIISESKNGAKEEAIKRTASLDNDGIKMTNFRVTFVGCTSPEAVYFRTPEMMQDFIKIQNALLAHFHANEELTDEEPTISLEDGILCAVKCHGRWYRAKVVSLFKDDKVVTVSLVDKGYSITVDASSIRRLPDELESTPRAVLCCSLYGIGPPSGPIWNQKFVQHINDRLNGADHIAIGCRSYSNNPEGKILLITVYISKEETDPDKVSDDVQIRSVNLNEELRARSFLRN